jgi:hypothetical protein
MTENLHDMPLLSDPSLVPRNAAGEAIRSLSPSAISKLLLCPEQFRRSYMLGDWGVTNAAAVLGDAYHFARRANYEQKVWSGHDLSLSDLLDAYARGWQRAVDRDVTWRNDDPEATYTLGREMAETYHVKVSPHVQPVAVEEKFRLEVRGAPIKVIGVVDVRDDDGDIIDTKTANKGAKSPMPHWRVQALIYMAAYETYDFTWHVHSKTGKQLIWTPAQSSSLRLGNTPGRRRAAVHLIEQAWHTLVHLYRTYGIGQTWPGTGLVSMYACKSCSYRGRCEWQM